MRSSFEWSSAPHFLLHARPDADARQLLGAPLLRRAATPATSYRHTPAPLCQRDACASVRSMCVVTTAYFLWAGVHQTHHLDPPLHKAVGSPSRAVAHPEI